MFASGPFFNQFFVNLRGPRLGPGSPLVIFGVNGFFYLGINQF